MLRAIRALWRRIRAWWSENMTLRGGIQGDDAPDGDQAPVWSRETAQPEDEDRPAGLPPAE